MALRREIRENDWIGLESGQISTTEQVLEAMLAMERGVVILDGVSGCGKTRLLHRFRERRSGEMAVCSYRDIVEELLNLCRKPDGQMMERMDALVCACPVLAVEDLDYLRGLEDTQRILGQVFGRAAEKCLIILTGNALETMIPRLLEKLEKPRHLRCVYPGGPEAEMLAISGLWPREGLDRQLLEAVLTPYHWQGMYSLLRRGLLTEQLSQQITAAGASDEMAREAPGACGTFLDALWKWQEEHDDPGDFLQIRDCFCKAAVVLADPDGTIAFRAAELTKESGDLKRALGLYDQILVDVILGGTGDPAALARGHYWSGAVRGYRAQRDPETGPEQMRAALGHFRRALEHLDQVQSAGTPERIRILWAMTECHAFLKAWEQADACCREVLALRAELPEDHPDRAETCIMFSQFCRDYGRRQDCQKWLLEAAGILEKCAPGEKHGWMYGLVATNCWKLPAQTRLAFCETEKTLRAGHFLRNPRELLRWHRRVSRLYEGQREFDRAIRHKEEEVRLGKDC